MNKNTTAVILIVLAVGIYFTFTRSKMLEIKSIRDVNKEYQQAIDNAKTLVDKRDKVRDQYNEISETDRDYLNKLVPDNVDNVRLIIDVKDDIAAKNGLTLKNIKSTSPESQTTPTGPGGRPVPVDTSAGGGGEKYGVVTLSFGVTTTYETFINFLKDLEASLRIMDVSKLSITSNAQGAYDFNVEIKTYWLKQ
jgi:Tfp pilus assembly protein PilO